MSGQDKLSTDPVKAALEIARRFSTIFNKYCRGKDASALPRRLKEFPQILLQAGLVPAFTFYASKLGKEEDWEIFIEALKAVATSSLQSLDNRICNNISGEGEGYPHALAILYAYAATISDCNPEELAKIASQGAEEGRGSRSNSLAEARIQFVECLSQINSKGIHAERLMLAYANEVKKLFTALYPSKR